jgi:hypothetical protein
MRYLILLAALPALAADMHHISMHGQSLCVGTLGSPKISATQPNNNKRLISSGAALEALTEGNTAATGFSNEESPASGMANNLTALAGWNVLVERNDCAGGQAYSVLKKGGTGGQYAAWLTALQAASATVAGAGFTYRYSGAITIHGETDYNNAVTGATYESYLQEWQSNIAADVAATYGSNAAPMLVSQMATWGAYNAAQPLNCTYATCSTQARGVPLGQLDAARDNPSKVYFLGPKYQYPYADSLHLTNQGYLQLGELAGKAWKKILVDGAYWTGLVPRSIMRSGATITLQLWVPAGSVTLDTTTLPDATYCLNPNFSGGAVTGTQATCVANGGVWIVNGFEYYDGSGVTRPYISSVSVTSADTITIMLSADPGANSNQRLRYAFTGNTKFSVAGSTQAHGNIRDSDTAVGVTSGAHLYDWLATFDDPIGFTWAPPAPRRGLFPLPSPRRIP